MVATGDIVFCRQTGMQLWIVRSEAPGNRWRLRGQRTSEHFRPKIEKGAKQMMSDQEFFELQLRMQICPGQCAWPKPDVTFSIMGDKPTAKGLHWQRLHDAVIEARERVSKYYTLADRIDRSTDLSRDGKYHQRSKIAAEAIADFEASKALARAREAVEHALKQHVSPEIADARDATLKAMKEAEAGWQKAINKIAERAGLTKGPYIRRTTFLSPS